MTTRCLSEAAPGPSGPRVLRTYAHDRFVFPLPPGHRFPLSKYALTRDRVALLPDVTILEAEPVGWDEIALVHDREWVRRLRYGLLDRRELRGLGLPWSPALATRARYTAGSTRAACVAARADGVAAALGGGMHHAGRRRGRGYCYVNDVAIAIALARRDGVAGQILILDLDVHQGDGNAEIFADDPTVTVVSLHGARNYPFPKLASDLDVELPDGLGDDGYLSALDGALEATVRGRSFVLAFLLAGADPWTADALGRLALTKDGLRARDRMALLSLADASSATVITLAGGYGVPIDGTADIHAATVEEAARLRRGLQAAPG